MLIAVYRDIRRRAVNSVALGVQLADCPHFILALQQRAGVVVGKTLIYDLGSYVNHHENAALFQRVDIALKCERTAACPVQVIGSKFVLDRPSHRKDKKDKIGLVKGDKT